MRRPLLASLLLSLAGAACSRPAPPAGGAVADAGAPDAAGALLTLEALLGEVQLQHAAAPGGTPAVAGPLRDGDTVQTGAGAGATLRLPDGRSVEVGPGASVRVHARGGRIELEVLQGVVLSRTPAAGASSTPLAIRTPQGLAQLGAAGEVQVGVQGDEARVEVRLGEVEFIRTSGERTRGAAGDVLQVTAGRVEVLSRERRVVALAPLQVTVRAEGRGAQLRRRGAAAWRTLGLQEEALAPGDALRTHDAAARLSLQDGGSALLLQRDAELSFVGAGQEEGEGRPLDEARVELLRGGLALQLAPGRSGRLVLGELTVESDGGSGLQLERGAGGLTVAAQVGDATLVRGDERQALRAGERVQVPRGEASGPLQVEPVPRAPVALEVAEDGAPLQVFHPGLAEVALAWGGEVPPEGVQVEVASDAAFTHPVLAGRVYQPFVNVPAPARGVLYWRVTGTDGVRRAEGSARFAPEPRRRPLAQLRNEVAEGPERTTIFYQDKPPAVTFTWAEVPGAQRYQLAVYRADALERPVASALAAGGRAALEAGALGEGRFLWAVTPLGAGGTALRGGRMNKLELVYDNSVPTLVLTAPRHGARAGVGPVRVAGVAPVGSQLSVNGEPVSLDAKGRFDVRVAATGQPRLLQFRMRRPGAPATLTVRRLR